ncbi:cytochrome P450 [Yinghuangia soli]|uniref:Cytochrome P450 n=1 Tax=Yinghuangia soli TaxID=2908204 RepID=A0AA41U7K3_9ACTN|nr:cytochrome P450 [Yinghuangia soli]MCF2532034.1 cytochrome P450 [Yinghuangia soli]
MTPPRAPDLAAPGCAVPDLTDPDLYADGHPLALWRTMRARTPLHWQPVAPDLGFWAATRYADVERVLRDHEAFSSEHGTLLSLLGRRDPAAGHQLAATDPPRHGRLRAPVHQALRAGTVDAHRTEVRAGIRALLPYGTEPFDFAAAMRALPLVLLGVLMGLPEEDRPHLIHLAFMASAEDDPDYRLPEGPRATLQRAHRELFAYFADLVRDRVRRPRDDLVGVLLAQRRDGERVPPSAVVSNCYSLLLGAVVSLSLVPAAAVRELGRDGGFARWAARPDLLDSGIEEALRWATPGRYFMRTAKRPVHVAGTEVAEGQAVLAFLAAANRDERAFAEPDVFDVARRPNRHLAFGAGHHYCVGSNMARLTLRLLFEELFAMYASLDVVGEPVRVRSMFLGGYKALPVRGRPRPKSQTRGGHP